MTFYWLCEWLWGMSEPTPTWSNFDFGQFCMWMGANNNQIGLPRGQSIDWAIYKPTPTWPNYISGQRMWIGTNKDQIWFSWGQKNDFEQY